MTRVLKLTLQGPIRTFVGAAGGARCLRCGHRGVSVEAPVTVPLAVIVDVIAHQIAIPKIDLLGGIVKNGPDLFRLESGIERAHQRGHACNLRACGRRLGEWFVVTPRIKRLEVDVEWVDVPEVPPPAGAQMSINRPKLLLLTRCSAAIGVSSVEAPTAITPGCVNKGYSTV